MTKKYFKNRFLPFIIIPLLFLSCKKENNKEMINSSISTNENKKLIDGINLEESIFEKKDIDLKKYKYNGVYLEDIYINDGFGKFSTIEKGFEGYLSLLQKNYVSAYEALTNDVKTISDFTTGLQLKGKYGAYATDPTYISGIQTIFKGVVSDYKKILECKLCKEKNDTIKNEIRKDIELLNKLK